MLPMQVLQKSRIMSSNLLRYAVTERNILAYIRHPYIVSLHYAFQTPSHLVLVLQYCPRGNLQSVAQLSGCCRGAQHQCDQCPRINIVTTFTMYHHWYVDLVYRKFMWDFPIMVVPPLHLYCIFTILGSR